MQLRPPTRKTMATGLLTVGLLTLAPSPASAGRGPDEPTAECRNQSDPDGDSNGGADKPGGTGGVSSDRDCNDGCGNDDDREDDNRGRCLEDQDKSEPIEVEADVDIIPAVTASVVSAAGTLTATSTTAVPGADVDATVAGTTVSGAAVSAQAGASDPATATDTTTTTTATTGAEPATEVLGATLTRGDDADSSPSSLPSTGAGVAGLTVAGGLLFVGGRLVSLARRLLAGL